MTGTFDAVTVRSALAQRLRAAAETLLDEAPPRDDDPSADAAALLAALVTHTQASGLSSHVWLLMVAASGCLPSVDDVEDARRRLELLAPTDAQLWLLDRAISDATEHGRPDAEMDIVTGGVVADVDFTARHDLHTGIQRVVRETIPRWAGRSGLVLAAWTERFAALRHVSPAEESRVVRWSSGAPTCHDPDAPPRLVVPWQSTLLLLEVPVRAQSTRLAGLAAYSGNRVVAVGYDCIPVVSADLVPPAEPDKFARYLTVLKYADLVVSISESAAQEFRGFAAMLPAQGLDGPSVVACPLPVESHEPSRLPRDETVPLVVVVGSHEPRKNHLAVLHAARRLWREGHEFSLRFIGGSGWDNEEFEAQVAAARRVGGRITAERAVDDADLWAAYHSARFTVFPSLHEGYGLPVAESLACGTPVITSDVGSMREIALGGGAVLIDPRDDEALYAQMRLLLTDDALLQELGRQAGQRPQRSWDDYTRELWMHVSGEAVR